MRQKLREYFMRVSNQNVAFAEEMISEMNSYIKKKSDPNGTKMFYFFGSDLERAAVKTNADLSGYFNPGDLSHFEMDVKVSNGMIESVVYIDGYRKVPVEL